jgi:hypothetical protein
MLYTILLIFNIYLLTRKYFDFFDYYYHYYSTTTPCQRDIKFYIVNYYIKLDIS